MSLDSLSEPMKHAADASMIAIGVGALAQVLPSIAALLTVIWLAIRIWESDTVRGITRRPLTGKRADE
jgi:hypothetical protein